MEPGYNDKDQLIMPDIGVVEEEGKKEKSEPLSDAEQIKLLNTQVADLTKAAVGMAKESSDREERMMGMISQTLGSQQVQQVQQLQAPEPVSFPDPVEDSEGFHKALIDSIQKTVGQSVGAVQAANQQVMAAQTSVDTVWRDFVAAYPEQAKFPEIVKSVYRDREAQLQPKMGVDPRGFMRDVAAGVDVILDNVREEKKESTEEPNRTGGIGGDGSMAGSGTGIDANKDEGSFVDEIKEVQREGGYR